MQLSCHFSPLTVKVLSDYKVKTTSEKPVSLKSCLAFYSAHESDFLLGHNGLMKATCPNNTRRYSQQLLGNPLPK